MDRRLVIEKIGKFVDNFEIKGLVIDSSSGRFYISKKLFPIKVWGNHIYFLIPWIRIVEYGNCWYQRKIKFEGMVSINKCVEFKSSICGMLIDSKNRNILTKLDFLFLLINEHFGTKLGKRWA